MLQRLFDRGLTPEFDMAGFMRTGGTGDADRFRILRDQIRELRERVIHWIVEPTVAINPQTKGYADLMFAYALAKLGETAHCDQILADLSPRLDRNDPIHQWVFQAFGYRIKQSLAGETGQDSLPDELLKRLEHMPSMDRYKLEKMRQRSYILEPHVRINPYLNTLRNHLDEPASEMLRLQSTLDRDELREQIECLMTKYSSGADRVRLLPYALQASARVDEKCSCALLELVPAAIEMTQESIERAIVLQQASYIAAHYGQLDHVQGFLRVLTHSLPEIVADYLRLPVSNANDAKIQRIDSLFAQSFRGLRKLGMRDEIGELYGRVAQLVEKNEPHGKADRARLNSGREGDAARPFRLLLCVAGGWFYFGQSERARQVVDQVRDILFTGDLQNVEQKNLACAYLNAVSQAPAEEAIARVQELFIVNKRGTRKLPRIGDNMTTSSHFSISQLDLVESAVLSLVSEDFALNADTRRWLDEDEFIVRSRIHRDVRDATGS